MKILNTLGTDMLKIWLKIGGPMKVFPVLTEKLSL